MDFLLDVNDLTLLVGTEACVAYLNAAVESNFVATYFPRVVSMYEG